MQPVGASASDIFRGVKAGAEILDKLRKRFPGCNISPPGMSGAIELCIKPDVRLCESKR